MPGSDSARSFARKLGERRCHLVGREFSSPSVLLQAKSPELVAGGLEGVAEVARNRTRPLGHEFITTFDSLRQDVFLEMAHFEEVEGARSSQLAFLLWFIITQSFQV